MPRLIDANALMLKARWMEEPDGNGILCDLMAVSTIAIENAPTVDAVPAEQFNALKSLVNGEWVDCKLVQETLGIDFATGLKMFDFSRTAEWNPAPLNGQKITTKFRIKNAVVHGRWEPIDHDGSWRVDMCSICHRRMHYVDYDQPYQYCPNCGAKMVVAGKKDSAELMVSHDVVPVVRCKNCVSYEERCPSFGYCYHWDYEQGMSPNQVDADDFCSYGERRTDERKAD